MTKLMLLLLLAIILHISYKIQNTGINQLVPAVVQDVVIKNGTILKWIMDLPVGSDLIWVATMGRA